ncbi:CZB domain-containing protein [Celeribacter neptunius]|uniref:Chemoreceptor zinc-binding domain-containing protein n=1 Tax=Celeribacter neptunius TaxID=588602 RepID=A0A1I3WIA6_9RHOB|nr:CZB domain-containing protein [Celeribacter neptunius]SFK06577.1 Chemoreceptor zinc-binding domain-containing protein [Celeribacter neptunius]
MAVASSRSETQIRDAICAHGDWRRALDKSIDHGVLDKSAAEIADNTQCAFGQWLTELEGEQQAGSPSMQKLEMVKRIHARFHTEAGQIAHEVELGNHAEARKIFDDNHFRRVTNSLVLNLHDWRKDFPSALGASGA